MGADHRRRPTDDLQAPPERSELPGRGGVLPRRAAGPGPRGRPPDAPAGARYRVAWTETVNLATADARVAARQMAATVNYSTKGCNRGPASTAPLRASPAVAWRTWASHRSAHRDEYDRDVGPSR